MKKDKLKTKMLFLSEISPILRVWKPLLFCGPFERGLMRRPHNALNLQILDYCFQIFVFELLFKMDRYTFIL